LRRQFACKRGSEGVDLRARGLLRSHRQWQQDPEIDLCTGVAMIPSSGSHAPTGAGIGLRLPHLAEIVATPSVVFSAKPSKPSWLEIHPENFLANPHATELLLEARRDFPVSVHTVGVSIGSAGGIDRGHLRRLRSLIEMVDPFLVSGHLAWSTDQTDFLDDLLSVAFH